ncbi:MAG: glycosyltransferase family 2 protein [Succinivibrionaceae bacterium]
MTRPITVVIPTYNAGTKFLTNAEVLKKQRANISEVIIIDSSSKDDTIKIAKDYNFTVEIIDKKDFGHGKTRQYALEKAKTEIVVFLTQDALLADENSIDTLVKYLESDENLAAVYGRQLPHKDANPLAMFSRYYNYPEKSFKNKFEDRKQKGIKTAFLSNSFAAYKKTKVLEVGGFPKDIEFAEDFYVAAKLLLKGYQTGYCAEAKVYHSHNLTLHNVFNRYIQIGKFHKNENWCLETFGKIQGEGISFIKEELKYLRKNNFYLFIPYALCYNFAQFFGYKIGNI